MIKKLYKSLCYSLDGIKVAYQQEPSLRIEAYVLLPLLPVAILLAGDVLKLLALIAPIFVILALELINTAIEAVCDMYTTSEHPQIKIAKDCGSAAVFLAILWLLVSWSAVLIL